MKSAVLADSGPLYAAVDPDDAGHPKNQGLISPTFLDIVCPAIDPRAQ